MHGSHESLSRARSYAAWSALRGSGWRGAAVVVVVVGLVVVVVVVVVVAVVVVAVAVVVVVVVVVVVAVVVVVVVVIQSVQLVSLMRWYVFKCTSDESTACPIR